MIKPLYLLADSQLLFWKGEGGLPERIRQDLSSGAKAAYIGASNHDQREFYDLFVAAMELMGISNCRMIPAQLKDEDKAFLQQAELLLLAGGNVELGWSVFESNGLKDLIPQKRYDGCTLIGVSAGAVQLGLGTLSEDPQPKKVELFRFAPFYVGAHDEKNEWWDLRALVNLSQSEVRGIGIPAGGGAIYWPDGTLEPLRRPLTEFMKEGDQVIERLLVPATAATDI
ncbi:MAG TPA: Type 1 glutamine amidotransferase-like domain-containing protein [Candidatus Angelobacter sp.]|nr:Type 1 glutamine amidotransferase-like domain-containing protein [Candidatus Angelobacter sp.]